MDTSIYEILPLCRKEKYYSSCVLPQIICGDKFERLHHFLKLLGIHEDFLRKTYNEGNLLFYTEYSLKDSALLWSKVSNLDSGEIPDLIFVLKNKNNKGYFLVVIECKMFSKPSNSEFREQLDKQKVIIDSIMSTNPDKWEGFLHVGILNYPLQKFQKKINEKIIFWENITKTYKDFLNRHYFQNILVYALKQDLFVDSKAQYNLVNKSVKKTMLFKNLLNLFPANIICQGTENPKKGLISISSGSRNALTIRIPARRNSKSINIRLWRKTEGDIELPKSEHLKKYFGECKGYLNYVDFIKKHRENFITKQKCNLFDRCVFEQKKVMKEWSGIILSFLSI